jgi:hypothetical protein
VANVRKINPYSDYPNYYLVDSNFLVNKFIPTTCAPAGRERDRVQACHAWWTAIDLQLFKRHARVYVPDICIAEAFKVLARKYYAQKWFASWTAFKKAKDGLSNFVRTDPRTLRAHTRHIRVHDISTNRDIIVSVDRFFELFFRHGKNVQIADLVLASTAKYLMDFYDIPKPWLHIVTLDTQLREGIAKSSDLPPAYDPTLKTHRASVVFD